MAIKIDQDLLKFTQFNVKLKTDRRKIQTNALKTSIYTTGATRLDFSVVVTTKTEAQEAYFNGIIIPNFLNGEEFELTLVPEYGHSVASDSISEDYQVETEVSAGSNTVVVKRSSPANSVRDSDFVQGNYLTIAGSKRLYTINSYDATGDSMVISPKIDTLLSVGAKITVANPEVTIFCINNNLDLKTRVGTRNFKQVRMMWQEVLV